MFQRGSFVILFIFGLATAMASFSVWVHYQQGRRCLAYWGSESANLIGHAPKVVLYALSSAGPDADSTESSVLKALDRKFLIAAQTDVSQARGLVHARHELLMDSQFDWSPSEFDLQQLRPDIALSFTAADRAVLVLVDFKNRRVVSANSSNCLAMIPQMAEAEQEYFLKTLPKEIPPMLQPGR